jgi:hypothetical protein
MANPIGEWIVFHYKLCGVFRIGAQGGCEGGWRLLVEISQGREQSG